MYDLCGLRSGLLHLCPIFNKGLVVKLRFSGDEQDAWRVDSPQFIGLSPSPFGMREGQFYLFVSLLFVCLSLTLTLAVCLV